MYALIIGRAFPDEKTGMMGIFEFEQAVALKKAGIKTAYAFCDTRSLKLLRTFNFISLEQDGVPVYGYHFPIGGLPKVLFEWLKEKKFNQTLNNLIKEQGVPDIIHIHFPLLNLTSKIWEMIKALNKPIIVTEHWSKVQTKQLEPYRVDLLKKIVHESDAFMCVGEQLRKSVMELTYTNKEIRIMPNMVKPIFHYNDKKTQDKTYRFIAIGRLVKNKRVDFLINAFTEAFRDNQHVMLEVVGDGTMFKEIQKQINDLGMSDRIIMHGFVSREETAKLLRESDAFVSASILETFGVPFIEAMASGKPIIGVENGPVDNYINKDNGKLFRQDDIESLATTLNNIYRSNFDGKKIARNANDLFSESAVADQIIDIYKTI